MDSDYKPAHSNGKYTPPQQRGIRLPRTQADWIASFICLVFVALAVFVRTPLLKWEVAQASGSSGNLNSLIWAFWLAPVIFKLIFYIIKDHGPRIRDGWGLAITFLVAAPALAISALPSKHGPPGYLIRPYVPEPLMPAYARASETAFVGAALAFWAMFLLRKKGLNSISYLAGIAIPLVSFAIIHAFF